MHMLIVQSHSWSVRCTMYIYHRINSSQQDYGVLVSAQLQYTRQQNISEVSVSGGCDLTGGGCAAVHSKGHSDPSGSAGLSSKSSTYERHSFEIRYKKKERGGGIEFAVLSSLHILSGGFSFKLFQILFLQSSTAPNYTSDSN